MRRKRKQGRRRVKTAVENVPVPGFVCGRKPVAAIHGLRYALGMRNFKYPGISSGGLMVYFCRPGDPKWKSVTIPVIA